MDFVPCLIGAVFTAAGNTSPALAGPSKGAEQFSIACSEGKYCKLLAAEPASLSWACCPHARVEVLHKGRDLGCLSAGKYSALDMRRSARLRGVPFRSMPLNSRASRSAQEPFYKSVPALRMLSAIRASSKVRTFNELLVRVWSKRTAAAACATGARQTGSPMINMAMALASRDLTTARIWS